MNYYDERELASMRKERDALRTRVRVLETVLTQLYELSPAEDANDARGHEQRSVAYEQAKRVLGR